MNRWKAQHGRLGTLTAMVASAVLAVGMGVPVAQADPPGPPSTVPPVTPPGYNRSIDVQLLSITDYHGALVPGNTTITDSAGTRYQVGGGAYLAAHFDRLSEGERNSFRFTAGDSISSAPAYDQWHRNEPAVEFLNHIGIEFNTIGNHEFDHSAEFLIEHIGKGNCMFGEPDVDSCFVNSQGEEFAGSDFPHLTANFVDRETMQPLTDPYVIKYVRGATGRRVPIAFLSVTFQRNGNLETQSYQPGLLGLDAVETANKYAEELDRKGVKAIVLSIHEGGDHSGRFDNCVDPTGPLLDYAGAISPRIDAIVGAHTHQAFNCLIDDPAGQPRPVVQAGSAGSLLNEIDLRIDPVTGDVIRERTVSINHPVTRDVTPDPVVTHMAEYWQQRLEDTASQPVAEIGGDFMRTTDDTGQSTLGNAAADAMYEDSQLANDNADERADLAMVPVRVFGGSSPFVGDLLREPGSNPADSAGIVLFEEWQRSFGYRNPVLTVTVTGAAIHDGLEGQWRTGPAGEVQFRPLAMSGNTRYSFDPSAPVGERVDPADVLIDGEPLALDREYRLAGLTYNLWGRDGHVALTDYTGPVVRGSVDNDAFLTYLRRHAPATPPALDRVSAKTN